MPDLWEEMGFQTPSVQFDSESGSHLVQRYGDCMIRASDVAKRIKEYDPLIDKFIEERLIPVLTETGKYTTDIPESSLNSFYQDNGKYPAQHVILNQFRIRGFSVEYRCDDRPCGSCWYRVTIPPQGE